MVNPMQKFQPPMRSAVGGQQQFSGGPFAQFMDPRGAMPQQQQAPQAPAMDPGMQASIAAANRGTLADPNLHHFVQSPWGDPGVMKDWNAAQQQQAAAAGPAWHSSDGMSGSVGPHAGIGLAGGAHSTPTSYGMGWGAGNGGNAGKGPFGGAASGIGGGGGIGAGGGSWGGGGNLGGLGGVGQGQVGQQLSNYQNQANQANSTRYNQLLQMAGQLSNAGMQREQQRQNFELGRVDQHAISSGLGNTTVLPSLERGAIDQSAIRQQEIGDQGLKTAMGIVQGRTDMQPDYGLLAQLAGRPGASGGSLGFGGGFGGGGGGGNGGGASIFDSNGLPGVNPMLDSGNTTSGVNAISSGTGGPSGPAGSAAADQSKQALIQQLVGMMTGNMPSGGGMPNMSGPQGGMQFDQYGNPIDPNTGQPLNNSGRNA